MDRERPDALWENFTPIVIISSENNFLTSKKSQPKQFLNEMKIRLEFLTSIPQAKAQFVQREKR